MAAGSRARERLALPDPAGPEFQSGEPCDAEAVADALRLHGDPVEAPINAFFWRNVAGVRAEGDEVLVELHEPSAGMPRLLRSWHSAIHNQAARRAAGDDFGRTTCRRHRARSRSSSPSPARTSTSPAGTATAARAPTGRRTRGRRYLDGVRWIPILDDRERAAALERGEIDCLQNASLLDVDRLAANPELEVIEFQQSALVYMGVDCETRRRATSASGARSRWRSTGRRSSTAT